jgi:hypothetical protein
MALSPITVPGTDEGTRTQFFINTSSAGSSGTVYTVPAGKIFVGFFTFEVPESTTARININGVDCRIDGNATSGDRYANPIYLSGGDVVANYSTDYFNLTGYEE